MQSINRDRQKGQSLVEYLVIVAIVAVGGIGIMRTVGNSVNIAFAHVAESLGANVDGKIGKAEISQSQIKKKSLRNFMNGTSSKTDDLPDEDNGT